MPFAYVMQNLQNGQAAKRPSWRGGYVRKDEIKTGDEVTGYKYTFVTAEGDQYVYTYTIATGAMVYTGKIAHGSDGALGTGTPDPSSKMEFDPVLFAGMLSDDWFSGSAETFEAARTGDGLW